MVAGFLTTAARAEQMVRYGDYQIHYIAFPSTFLQPEVAKALNIRRSKGIGVINVSVRKERPDGTTEPVSALVKGTATNQVEQQRVLDFQRVEERGGAYSLAQFLFTEGDPLRMDLEVWAEPGGRPFTVTFSTSLYPE
ncbi:MAG: DUF4426 domain-containing protein [Gammaproteobacteria bacterium]|nr:MAG: DUF4426 domain-containing protein [Gammaproteobacteria bacterium]